MRKLVLWLFISLVLVWSVSAIDVNLLHPSTETYASSTDRIDFKCGASGGAIYEMELYTNISGNWIKTGTSCYYDGISQANCTFTVLDIPAGTYKYNCIVNQVVWAPNNHSFEFIIVNDPPEFSGILENKSWSKNTVLENVWDLDNYFSDPNGDPITYAVHGNNKIDVEITGGVVKLTPLTDWTGSETINFSATDDKDATTYSNSIVLTVIEDSSPLDTEICDDDIDNDGDGYIDCQDSDCPSSPNNCQDAICNTTSYDWQYTLKSGAECDSDSDCDSGYECSLSSCSCVEISSADDEDEIIEEEEETGLYIISNHFPVKDKINISIGNSKTFKIIPSGDTEVRWYLNEEKVGEGESYKFKAEREGTYELVAVIGNNPTVKSNDDFYMWIVTVGEEDILASNICGNERVDPGENCENCPRDVKCAKDEVCREGECVKSKGFFSRVSGFAVTTKDFVVEKWKYSSVIAGIIIVLIVFGILYASKKKKKDVLYEFGKERFVDKIKKIFKSKKRKGYLTKKLEEEQIKSKPVVETQKEIYIDKKPFSDDDKI